MGSTGAGKTTIINLINRFYELTDGTITYDGIDVKDIKKDAARRSMSMVIQDTHLFTGDHRGQYPLRAAERHRRGHPGCCRAGQRRLLHPPPARRVRYHALLRRLQIVPGTEAAAGHRAGRRGAAAGAGAGRGHQQRGYPDGEAH